ncbi:hypothetical protein MCOR29_002916 [Pyricularia oryzae]|uniref:ARB-07466-like C-terminal domain-containing protein n=1 Tax=Pyricularia grisea TaxID=148305 RepID=A0ABQ8NKI5_PYRGI|nr:hypothetical protein MCOR33_005375 [Pyricularia grisea]KAI6327613.1 hypothetical protein MCOR29_002916 [Pyricularia oryzae]KAI6360710.1 hypothetical protein MCOR31_009002 [Pyricularia oryzae]KAI6424706.1 hypothetical protein MCOR24_003273 [Pyricularia oryzae]KAI6497207.1 hypothetical protein MCOR11_004568 [Pyricularia oryzae]
MDLMVQQVCISNPTLQANILLFSRLSNSSTLLSSNKKGVCLSSSECTSEGGKTIDGAGRIVEAWPGRIRQIYCARDCRCGEGSDHCCGKATDMMCSEAGGAATLAGREVAEWAVRNRDELCHLGSENEARQEGREDGLGQVADHGGPEGCYAESLGPCTC